MTEIENTPPCPECSTHKKQLKTCNNADCKHQWYGCPGCFDIYYSGGCPQCNSIYLTVNEMKEVQKPINAAIYKSKNCYDKPHPNDKIMCELCGVGYTRSNYPKHKITRKHKMCAEMNQKMMKLLLNSK